MHTIRKWLALCKRASRMSPEKFTAWRFMVGVDGTIEARTRLGILALQAFGINWNYTVSHVDGGGDE